MICPFCRKEKLNRHLIFCKENKSNLSKIELRKYYLEYNYPDICLKENLIKNYVELKMSLPDILLKFGVDYNSIKFLLSYYKIHIRGYSEGSLGSMSKRKITNIRKYGSENVLSKGTIGYDKKNETVKNKYGVDNVFQIPEIINRINSDEIYLERYNLTVSEFRRIVSSKFWNSFSESERIKFVEVCNEKKKLTSIKNFGTEHPKQSDEIKNKLKISCLEKYGVEYYFQSDEFLKDSKIQEKIKNSKILSGEILSDVDIGPFKSYKRNCKKLTSRNRKKLFENWNGFDYYDREYIKGNVSLNQLDPNYPTIDHKISIFHGFINGIPEEIVSSIDNLCITKRKINSSKRTKTNIEYEAISKNLPL